jgi:hypothetical protein
LQNEVPGDLGRGRKVISERVCRRRIGHDLSFLPLSIVIESSFRVHRVLSGEVPPLFVLLLQPIQELGKLHLDALDIRAELFGFRMNRLDLDGYVTGFFGEVFQVCLFQTFG